MITLKYYSPFAALVCSQSSPLKKATTHLATVIVPPSGAYKVFNLIGIGVNCVFCPKRRGHLRITIGSGVDCVFCSRDSVIWVSPSVLGYTVSFASKTRSLHDIYQ